MWFQNTSDVGLKIAYNTVTFAEQYVHISRGEVRNQQYPPKNLRCDRGWHHKWHLMLKYYSKMEHISFINNNMLQIGVGYGIAKYLESE